MTKPLAVADQCSSNYFTDVIVVVRDRGCFSCGHFLKMLCLLEGKAVSSLTL